MKLPVHLKGEYAIFILFLILFAIFTKHNVGGVNDASAYATTESLVERGTFAIDDSTFNWTIDKIYVNGHFYGLKPFLSIMGAIPYFILYRVFNVSFTTAPEISYYMVTFFTVGLMSAILMMFFYKSLNFIYLHEKFKYLLTFALGAGTLIFPYTTTFNNHTVSASFLFIGFYFLLKSRFHEEDRKNSIFLSASFTSLSFMISIPEFVFVPAFFIYILYSNDLKKFSNIYLSTVLVFTLLYFIVNMAATGGYIVSGTFLYFLKPDIINYPGSYWNNPRGIDVLNDPIPVHAFNVLFGHQGIFLFTPILIFSVFALLRTARDSRHLFFRESITIGAAIFILLTYFLFIYPAYSGFSFGFRFFIPETPLLFFFMAFLFKEIKSEIFYKIFYVLLFASVFMSFIGTGFYPVCTNCPWAMYSGYAILLLLFTTVGVFWVFFLPFYNDIFKDIKKII